MVAKKVLKELSTWFCRLHSIMFNLAVSKFGATIGFLYKDLLECDQVTGESCEEIGTSWLWQRWSWEKDLYHVYCTHMTLVPDHGGISRPHSCQHLTIPLKVATTALNLMKNVSFFVLFLFLVSLLPSSLTVCVFCLLEHLHGWKWCKIHNMIAYVAAV